MHKAIMLITMFISHLAHSAADVKTKIMGPPATLKQLAIKKAAAFYSSPQMLAQLSHDPQALIASVADVNPDAQELVVQEMLKSHKDIMTKPIQSQLLKYCQVAAVAYHPNGKQLAVGSKGATICIWDLLSAQESMQLKGHKCVINALAYNEEGTQLASGDVEGDIFIWDLKTGEQLCKLWGLNSWVDKLCYNPKHVAQLACRHYFYCDSFNNIQIWNVDQNQIIHKIAELVGNAMAYHPQGTECSICNQGRVAIYDTERWQLIRQIYSGVDRWIMGVVYNPQHAQLLLQLSAGNIILENRSALPIKSFSKIVAFNKTGTILATQNYDGIDIWDTFDWKLLIHLNCSGKAIALNPNGLQVALVTFNYVTHIVDIPIQDYAKEIEPITISQASYIIGCLTKVKQFEKSDEQHPGLKELHHSLPANFQYMLEHQK